MLGQDFTTSALPPAGLAHVQPVRPQPVQRTVESVAKSHVRRFDTPSMYAAPPSAIEQLSSSARQFADVLDTTGNVQVASSVSGFVVGHVDLYA
jgi:hypothetical protein